MNHDNITHGDHRSCENERISIQSHTVISNVIKLKQNNKSIHVLYILLLYV